MLLLDTNILIRFIAGDDPDHSPRTLDFFDRLNSGEVRALLLDGVIVEATQVLSSKRYFAGSRATIVNALQVIIGLYGLNVQNREVHRAALQVYATSKLDYVDCLLIALVQLGEADEILSFDRDFDRVDGITRVEP